MQVEHPNVHPLTSLRPAAKPGHGDPTQRRGQPEKTAQTAQTARPPSPSATPVATNVTLAAVNPDALSTGPRPDQPLTVDGLLEAWGEKNSRYDIDGDGTVNMRDLLELLAQIAAGENGDSAPDAKPAPDRGPVTNGDTQAPPLGAVDPDTAPGDPVEPMTVAGLLEAWGERSSRYDLDDNGRVEMADLLQLLAQLNEKAASAPRHDPGNGAPVPGEAPKTPATADPVIASEPGPPLTSEGIAEEAPAPQLTLKGLLDAWGERGSQYDLDANGTVNMNDLLELLSRLSPDTPLPGDTALASASPDITSRPGLPAESEQRVGRIAASLLDRLEQRGFQKQPPTNIHQIVSSLDLAPDEHKGVIQRLSDHYAHGLGINLLS